MWLVKLDTWTVVGNSFVSSRFCRLLTCTWGRGIEARRICERFLRSESYPGAVKGPQAATEELEDS